MKYFVFFILFACGEPYYVRPETFCFTCTITTIVKTPTTGTISNSVSDFCDRTEGQIKEIESVTRIENDNLFLRNEMQAEILNAYGKLGVEMLKNAVAPYSATGKTEASIRYESTPFSLKIFGRQFFSAIETGRGPRKSSTDGNFDDSMLEYMKARGIGSELNEKKRKQLARFLTWKINKEGDETFKKGGREVYSDKLDAFIVELEKALADDFTKSFLTSIQNTWHSR